MCRVSGGVQALAIRAHFWFCVRQGWYLDAWLGTCEGEGKEVGHQVGERWGEDGVRGRLGDDGEGERLRVIGHVAACALRIRHFEFEVRVSDV
jgi:hypothetical protein